MCVCVCFGKEQGGVGKEGPEHSGGGWVGSDEEEVECDQPLVAAAAAFLDHHL